jgi:hypothetical protein
LGETVVLVLALGETLHDPVLDLRVEMLHKKVQLFNVDVPEIFQQLLLNGLVLENLPDLPVVVP